MTCQLKKRAHSYPPSTRVAQGGYMKRCFWEILIGIGMGCWKGHEVTTLLEGMRISWVWNSGSSTYKSSVHPAPQDLNCVTPRKIIQSPKPIDSFCSDSSISSQHLTNFHPQNISYNSTCKPGCWNSQYAWKRHEDWRTKFQAADRSSRPSHCRTLCQTGWHNENLSNYTLQVCPTPQSNLVSNSDI